MDSCVDSPWIVPFDGSFEVKQARTAPPKDAPKQGELLERREELTQKLARLQGRLYAGDRHALLVVVQAMDAAGKDGTIKAVLSGVNPTGCQVTSFKRPTDEELSHDFLWRCNRHLPERGMIGIFNRSYYEEVLVVRVHPEYLQRQQVSIPKDPAQLWEDRLQAIAAYEQYLARQGTVIVKLWLHVSKEEQRKRLLDRIEDPDRNWKFNAEDVAERRHWSVYMRAYEAALRATSKPWAPWYCIPADDKDYMRLQVADILVRTLQKVDPKYPVLGDAQRAALMGIREQLLAEEG